jgi:hypothetical protein
MEKPKAGTTEGGKGPSARPRLLAALTALVRLALPASVVGDYLVYRLGLAGKLARVRLPRPVVVTWRWAGVIGSLLLLPAVWTGTAWFLGRHGVPWMGTVLVGGLAASLCYLAVCWFDRAWACADDYRVGSATELAGRCVVFQLFVGPWRPRERARALRAVRVACDWLERQAEAHDVALSLVTEPASLCLLDPARVPAPALTWADPWRVYRREEDGAARELRKLRPQLEQAVTQRLQELPWQPDSVCVIAHLPHRRVGFALPAANDLQLPSQLEICACGRRSRAAVYAHELLHLFGASDLYFPPWRWLSDKGETDAGVRDREFRMIVSANHVLAARFGNSIMYQTRSPLERLRVDPLTARAVGWRGPDRQYMEAATSREHAQLEMIAAAVREMESE